jgi:hypothetical protein
MCKKFYYVHLQLKKLPKVNNCPISENWPNRHPGYQVATPTPSAAAKNHCMHQFKRGLVFVGGSSRVASLPTLIELKS